MSNRYWLAGLASIAALVLAVAIHSQRTWQSRATALAAENTSLALEQSRLELSAQAREAAGQTREIAASEAVLRLLQEPGDAGVDSLDIPSAALHGLDGLLVLSSTHAIRFGGVYRNAMPAGRLKEPAAARLREVAAAPSAPATVRDGDWITMAPVVTHGSGAPLGWVVAQRTIVMPAGAIAAPLSELGAAASGTGSPFDIATRRVGQAGGYVVVFDGNGRPAWAVRPAGLDPADVQDGLPGLGAAPYLPIVLLGLTALIAAAVFVARRYLRHQKSVDARYKALIDQANDGVIIVDASTFKVQYANPAILALLGYAAEEVNSLVVTDIFADGSASPENLLGRLRDTSSRMAMNLQQRCKNGALIDAEVRCNELDVDGREVLAYVTHDVSLRRKAEQQQQENRLQLHRMAHHDQLTGLPNRHYLTSFLPEAIETARAAGKMLGVVFLDLDRFKHINDTRGHETGDKLLQEVATRLRACVREADVTIRMGGDEFVVIFRNVETYDEVTAGAARIVEALNRPIIIDGHSLETTGSVGVSLYPRDGADMIELLKHSDTAMYQAKDRGRNNVQVFSHAMNKKVKQRVAVEASLREALRLKQLDVHYQPFVNLLTRKVVGLEALMRWTHPVHGMVPADQFIPVAEESGLIVPMGNFVLHRAMQHMSGWRKSGVPLVPVSINVAPAQLQRGDLQDTLATLLKTHGLHAGLIQLEMTERAVFDPKAQAADTRQDTLAKLRDIGIKIAIDDFGTGYSSLSYLKNWRVDALKIDRSFVRDLVTDSSDLAIVSAIIAIARHLNIQVIAEGIEGYQQAEILRRLGCAVGQGFLFSRPVPAVEVLQVLRDNVAAAHAGDEDMLAAFSTGRG
jgi:diguanylate cyclase (GGDEF)-like protein/PAS domain S-box-containing protein